MKCPLCKYQSEQFEQIQGRKPDSFFKCSVCNLVFRPSSDHLSFEKEQQRYLTHNNSLNNKGYVDFLMQAYDFAKPHMNQEQPILDFGCGYDPVFAKLMEQKSWSCHAYDPYFFPSGIQQDTYKNIFCIETVEHFNQPAKDWPKLRKLMVQGSILVVMTELWDEKTEFSDWHYSTDETHVSLYHYRTIQWIAQQYNWSIIASDQKRIIIFQA